MASFEDIAASEALDVRHMRRLAPLAFLSPKILEAIADGTAPSGLKVSFLTRAVPLAWSAREQMAGLRYTRERTDQPLGVSLAPILACPFHSETAPKSRPANGEGEPVSEI